MLRLRFVLVALTALAAGCGGSPNGPGGDRARVATLLRTRFLAFGDSLTAGEVTAPAGIGSGPTSHKLIVLPTASYPSQLQSMLVSRYATQAAAIAVVNAGVPGEPIFNGAARFADTMNVHQPEVVLVMEGVNGISFIGPDTSTAVMRTMVQSARSRNAMVFVGSMLPTIAGRQRSQNVAELLAYNATLQLMTQQEGAVYVDLYNALLGEAPAVIGVDGLHPTEAGYRRIADVFFNAIRANLEDYFSVTR